MSINQQFDVNFSNTVFTETSQVWAYPDRLNWRCELLLTRQKHVVEGKRILDLASHDGRFSYACLKLGAKHVTGVEGRPHLVEHAKNNLSTMGSSQKGFTLSVPISLSSSEILNRCSMIPYYVLAFFIIP